MSEPKVFEVTAIEYFTAVGDEDPKDPVIHIWKDNRIGTDGKSVEFKVQHDLSVAHKGDIAAFFNRLEVRVDLVNFPG